MSESKRLEKSISSLNGTSINVLDNDAYPEEGQVSVLIAFSDGTKLRANYWRMIKDGKEKLSSFDNNQKYGLPAPIDAKKELQYELNGESVLSARLDLETGDLHFEFSQTLKLSVFAFTGYEVWEIIFPDGIVEYSNYAKDY
ncbi:MAG: hypothetical protein JKP92_05855 [Alphaproteobacteria bacterium]|jgi:hypothetical protein|nr:hypothetical protein [Alphaproteobacteria bacterium]